MAAPSSTENGCFSSNVTDCFVVPLLEAEDNTSRMVYELRGRLLGTTLSTALFGVFTLCTCITVLLIMRVSIFLLEFDPFSQYYSRNSKLRKTRWAAWYTFATIAMFTSTSIYWAFILRDTFTIANITTSAADSLGFVVGSLQDCALGQSGSCDPSEMLVKDISSVESDMFHLIKHDLVLEYCVGTAALTTNIIVGDAIVLGRVYILWHRSRSAYLIFIVLLLGTVATGIVSTAHSCQGFGGVVNIIDPDAETTGVSGLAGPAAGNLVGSFFEGDPFGLAASALSLATNAISTCFIGYRAWEHRALVRGNGLRSFLGRSEVSRALTLLLESGAFYCVIWIFVVVYQFITTPSYNGSAGYKDGVASILGPHSSAYRAFTAGWEAFTEGGLILVVAIYPTVIMLLAALNRSECDTIASYSGSGQGAAAMSIAFRGSTHHAQSLEVPGGPSAQQGAPNSVSSLADPETMDCSS